MFSTDVTVFIVHNVDLISWENKQASEISHPFEHLLTTGMPLVIGSNTPCTTCMAGEALGFGLEI